MNYKKVTNEYYSKWLGINPEMLDSTGVLFVESSERDKRQEGYSKPFGVYTLVIDGLIVVSYSADLSDVIKLARNRFCSRMTSIEVANVIEGVFSAPVTSSIKFYYDSFPVNIDIPDVVKLQESDFPSFLEFYSMRKPNAKDDGWLEECFYVICTNDLVFGVFINERLVSVSEAPVMPYINNWVQEVGINTLTNYRGKGYAKAVTLSCIKSIIDKGKCPMWATLSDNIASEQLAYKVGFRKYAEVITL